MDANDERLWDALARWEELYQQGQDSTAEELCRDCPELLDQLKDRIWGLKRTAWMTKPTVDEGADLPEVASDQTPKTLGEYTILQRIGMGGMSAVFKATHRRMERTVVLKLLPRSSPEAAQRFQEEVKAAAQLIHPNIVHAYDAGESDGIPFLVMEFVEGIDLERHVQQHGPMPIELAISCIKQAAQALRYAHERGIIHRDVKPSNLLLSKDGTVKLLDLGLARYGATDKEAAMGTPSFMAPEQALTPEKTDHRADIYSLGCTFFFLLTGKPPFAGTTVIQNVVAHREGAVPSLKQSRPEVPAALDAVFMRMVAKQPQDRYQSMAVVITAIERQKRRTGRWLLGGIAAIAVLLAGLFLVQKWPNSHATGPTKATQQELRALNLDFTATTDADLEQFKAATDLGELRLTKTKITDAGLERLKGCTQLRFLDLHQNAISDAGLEHLQGLTELQHLGLSATKISDTGLRHLKGMKLLHLNLDFTEIGDEGLAHLAGMTSLTDLRLTRTRITDDGLAHLKGLTNLKTLDLHHTAVTDGGLKHLMGLPLKNVGVSGTKVTAAGLERLKSGQK